MNYHRRGIASGMEMGFYLLKRAGYDDAFVNEVARTMEYQKAYDLYRADIEVVGHGTVAAVSNAA